MQHVHYDLDKVEREIRRLFAEAPDDAISDDPEITAAYRRSVDIEVAASKWHLSEVMRGTDPEISIRTFNAIIVNIIMNRLDGFSTPPGEPDVIFEFIPDLIDGLKAAYNNRVIEGRKSGYGFDVNPVEGGRA